MTRKFRKSRVANTAPSATQSSKAVSGPIKVKGRAWLLNTPNKEVIAHVASGAINKDK